MFLQQRIEEIWVCTTETNRKIITIDLEKLLFFA